MARFVARRTRRSDHGDFGSHCCVNTSHWVNVGYVTLRLSPAERLISSACGPRSVIAMSVSPRFSIATRVDSSGTDLKTRRFTAGGLRQYASLASSTTSMPGVNETNRYGPAPTGALRKPSSPTRSVYAFGTIQPALVAGEP